MNKIFVASVVLAFGSMAQASTATANCVPAPVTYVGQNGGGTEVCTFSALPVGSVINWVKLDTVFDAVYDGFSTGLATNVATYSLTGPGSLGTSGTATFAGGTDSKSTPQLSCAQVGTICSTIGTSFNVLDVYTSTNAALTAATFNKRVTLDYAPGVPEPSTYAMMGLGLVGFFMARRKG